jgi:signal peptidase II
VNRDFPGDDPYLMRSWWPQSGAAALAADQLSKWAANSQLPGGPIAVLPFLDLTLTRNRGVAFSLFPSNGLFGSYALIALAVVILGLLLRWLAASRDRWQQLGLGLVLGGALGNITDRLFSGSVTDFIHFHVGGFSNVFNVADAAITLGVLLILRGSLGGDSAPTAS